jgi:Ca2+-binding EF-hand superfamily protein
MPPHSPKKPTNSVTTATMVADRDLTEDEVADLKEAFAMFDINGDGR